MAVVLKLTTTSLSEISLNWFKDRFCLLPIFYKMDVNLRERRTLGHSVVFAKSAKRIDKF